MEEVHFYLKRPPAKTSGRCLIYLQFNYYSDHRLKMTFQESIHPDMWDAGRERPKPHYKHYTHIDQLLDRYTTAVIEEYKAFLADRVVPSEDELKEAVQYRMDPMSSSEDNFIIYLMDFIKTRERQGKYSHESISTYKSMLKNLKEYSLKNDPYRETVKSLDEYIPAIPFEAMDRKWIERFMEYFKSLGREQNTLNRKITLLRIILTEALEDGMPVHMDYKSKRLNQPKAETTQIYLTEDEIERMYRLQDLAHLEKYRDIFVLLCYSAPRISDVYKLSKGSFIEENGLRYFKIMQQKTTRSGGQQHIPAHPYVLEIMDKYNWILPVVDSNNLNINVKVLARMAGIDEVIDIIKYPAGKLTITQQPKYTMVTTHTGRRSLASNMLLAGVPHQIIMSVGGWKTYESFQKYIRLTAGDKLKIAAESKFFKKPAKVVQLAG